MAQDLLFLFYFHLLSTAHSLYSFLCSHLLSTAHSLLFLSFSVSFYCLIPPIFLSFPICTRYSTTHALFSFMVPSAFFVPILSAPPLPLCFRLLSIAHSLLFSFMLCYLLAMLSIPFYSCLFSYPFFCPLPPNHICSHLCTVLSCQLCLLAPPLFPVFILRSCTFSYYSVLFSYSWIF